MRASARCADVDATRPRPLESSSVSPHRRAAATLIAAPSSTKNKIGERDPEIHQTKKGNQWCFGMKAHIGVDVHSGLVHTVRGTAVNVSDVVEGNSLLHGQETEVFADAGYQGADKRPDAPKSVVWHMAMKPGKRKVWTSRRRSGA